MLRLGRTIDRPDGQPPTARWNLAPLAAQVIAAHHGAEQRCDDPALLDVVVTSDRIVALLARDIGITPAALAGVPGLSAAEQRAVIAVVERIPEFLSTFEPPASPAQPPTAEAAVQEEPVATFPVRPAFDVSVRVAGRPSAYSAVAVGETALVVAGKEPLAANRLVSATMACGRDPFTIWALPQTTCRTSAGAHHVELRPFGLDAQARQRWNGLVATCHA